MGNVKCACLDRTTCGCTVYAYTMLQGVREDKVKVKYDIGDNCGEQKVSLVLVRNGENINLEANGIPLLVFYTNGCIDRIDHPSSITNGLPFTFSSCGEVVVE